MNEIANQTQQRLPKQQAQLNGLIFDWSYQFLTPEALADYAKKRLPKNFNEQRAKLLAGEYENKSEQRTVSHVLSRSTESPLIAGQHSRFKELVRRVRSGNWLGVTGKSITDIVNIGVGGSDLGPLMASFALKEFAHDIQDHHVDTHFVSSMDGGQLYAVLPIVNPETTLFVIASKSFGTLDTFANVETVKAWVQDYFSTHQAQLSLADWLDAQVVGISANAMKMTEYGIPPAHQLTFSDSVGGRFSLWSSIGFAIATSCGIDVFQRLQAGARAMDAHFEQTELLENIPMLMALIGLYNREERGINNLAILPYDGRFRHLPSYLQQLDMESNGKQYTADNQAINTPTGPIIWGGFGPNGQHAFFQHLHQGYDAFTADFVMVLHRQAPKELNFSLAVQQSLAEQQQLSVANCLAHRQLMAYGSGPTKAGENIGENSDCAQLNASDFYPGQHPSNLFAMEHLNPESFGALIAAYEHKIFVQGLIWQLNSFDQPGVELGKKVALDTLAAMQGAAAKTASTQDPSTSDFIQRAALKLK